MKLRHFMAIVLMALVAMPLEARDKTSQEKARKELKQRVIREARREARDLEKAGWTAVAGSLSLEKQIENSKIAEVEKDSYDDPKWIMARHTAIGANYSAAKLVATTRAKGELATAIKDEVKRSTKSRLAQDDLGDEQLALVDEALEAIVERTSINLRDVRTLIEIYRDRDHGKCEMQVRVAISYGEIRKDIVTKLKKELETKAKDIAKLIEIE